MRQQIFCYYSVILILLLTLRGWNTYAQKGELDTNSNLEKYSKFDESMQVHDIIVDEENTKWLATDKGLFKFASMNSDWVPVLQGKSIGALAFSKKWGVWAGSSDGVILDPDQQKVGKVANPLVEIRSMAYVKNLIWIGTNDGIYTYNPKLLKFSKHYTMKNSELPNDTVNVLLVDPKGAIFAGTNGGLAIIHKGKTAKRTWKIFNKSEKFQAATTNKEGVWIVSNKEMYLIDYNYKYRWYPTAVKRDLSSGEVRALAADRKGNIYIASGILVQFDPYEDKVKTFDQDKGFLSARQVALIADKNDDIWIGSSRKGIFRLETATAEEKRLTAIATTKKNNPCSGDRRGEIRVVVHGGKSPYNYKWNSPSLKGSRIRGLASGKYIVTVTDAEGHVYVTNSRVTEPAPLSIAVLNIENASAPGSRDGSARIHVDGGVPEYRIKWSNGARGPNLERALPGKNTVFVTDANKCKIQKDIEIGRPNTFANLKLKDLKVGQTLRVDRLQFDADSTDILKASEAILDDVYQFMINNPSLVIEVGGHTNGIPPHSYCDRLSKARARNVASYLVRRGIPAKRISYKGYGKRKPIATNRTKEGRAKNQRVEIKILKIN